MKTSINANAITMRVAANLLLPKNAKEKLPNVVERENNLNQEASLPLTQFL